MKIALSAVLAALLVCSQPGGAPVTQGPSAPPAVAVPAAFDQTHASFTRVLAAVVVGDRVDYKALLEHKAELDAYYESLCAASPAQLASWSREERFAFWINLYNAATLRLVAESYPIDSIKDLGSLFKSVWSRDFIPLGEHHPKGAKDKLSLDDVEHQILRPIFQDARVHAAVNCASVGCPPLAPEAFTAARLDAQLDARMRAFVQDTRRNTFDRSKNKLEVSELFSWFSDDFVRDAGSVKAYLRRYAGTKDDATSEGSAWIEAASLSHRDYSWKLNDLERPKNK